ncbi:hypothetical protein O7635_04075 [Asanoa sp. WMMD1127]|uniref:hypothetical protein n=1 Tax=Asanoa sp. WMMD1127 TaxID=3016107 RepID=UPI002416700E|nr:hypothetical protein [Asanoa sp. WMMD1127]MDG4821030.1 hypothetical protein [Asanoa sp. WMMD1127]
MLRARRIASIAVVAALGLGGLAACRSEPSVAAYLGDRKVTEDQVTQIFDGAGAGATATPAPQEQQQPGAEPTKAPGPAVSRQQVVDLEVSLDLGRKVASEQGVQPVNAVTEDQVAAELGVPAGSEYAKDYTEWVNLSQGIFAKIGNSVPAVTDDQLRGVYDALVKVNAIDPGFDLPQIKQAFGGGEFVAAAYQLTGLLEKAASASDTTVNPRYLPLSAPMVVSSQGGAVFYDLPYLAGSDTVNDRA